VKKCVPKLSRKDAYKIWVEYQKSGQNMNLAAKARELGISYGRLREQLKKIGRIVDLGTARELENFLAYRWKSGAGYSISIWAPDNPPE